MTPPYPSYKNSGVDRIGDIPSHWLTLPLKRRFSVVGGSTPKSDDDSFWEGDITWVTPADLSSRSSLFIEASARTITEAGLASCGATMVPPNSIVLSTRAPIGSLAVATTTLCTNQGCRALVPQDQVDSVYIAYVLTVSTKALNVRGRGTTFLELSGDELGAFLVPTPPLNEQRAIAAFLDRETGKIDAAVEEQRRLIALLKEKRQAVISHAVTKGLNPEAPMRPSGIDWLGDIPAHWNLLPLKRLSPSITVGVVVEPSQYISEDGLPFIYGADVGEGFIRYCNSRRIAPEVSRSLAKTQLRTGDLITVRVGAPGLTAVVPPECEGGNCASVMLIRQGDHPSEWLCYAMNSRVIRYQVDLVKYGAAQEQFNISHAIEFLVPVPPREEAEEIRRYVDHEVDWLNSLISEAETAVDILQERRSALISAAVTGKIDVRGEVADQQGEQNLEGIEASVGA